MYKHGRVTAFSLLLLAPNFLRGLLDEKRWVAKRFSLYEYEEQMEGRERKNRRLAWAARRE